MRLFLASEAKHPDAMTKMEGFVGGLKGKSIAYIPTAANGEGYESWKDGGSWKLVQTLNANVSLLELEEYRNSSVVDGIKGKDIVWFAGGMCGYLMYWIRRCELDKHLKDILDEGTVYVGSSAGSMITFKDINLSSWYIGDVEAGTENSPGLGLVDFEIYPHYEENLYEEIKKLYKGRKIYLLKNGEAVTVDGDVVKVLGEERIISNG
ncbi:MAG: Type 1 glutamine amidotransferase-like domain-containing protein [Candidatus Doudnabacteria bacterium]|nr:Type 1 glutamine amidotransferase-like domain-containing protein [Candidatus Doudnabacteria bacterium]